MSELVGEIVFQLFAFFAVPILEFLCRLLWWLVVGGVGTLWWLLVQGAVNWFCFYRDLWLRIRWRGRWLGGGTRVR
jgi:hypothetical protein